MKRKISWVIGLIGAVILAWQIFGGYNIAATEPHWGITTALLEVVRDSSIENHSDNIAVPDLSSENRILSGASNYDAMCKTCHLAPGVKDSEMHAGLYPQPPRFFTPANGAGKADEDEALLPAEMYWVIKNGLKLTGMPAWGPSHDEEAIWDMVAFLQKLPKLDAATYHAMIAKAKALGLTDDDDDEHGFSDHHSKKEPQSGDTDHDDSRH